MSKTIQTLDTAIVGGGITGLYACDLLHEKNGASYKTALFESSDRFGGRIETIEMDGFLAEYGPMRFEKRAQPLLMKLIRDSGLETTHFSPYLPATDPEALMNLAEDENRGSDEKPFNALEILTLGILRILRLSGGDFNDPRDPRHREWWAGLDEPFYQKVRTEITFRGQPLHQIGFRNILSMVLSEKAIRKIIHYGTFYHVVHYNPNAAEWINFWLRGLHPKEELVGIKQGTQALVTELVKKLSSPKAGKEPPALHLHHRLMAVYPADENRVRLEFETAERNKVEILARHLVLAIPQSPLKSLSSFFPDHIGQWIDSVIPVPLVKCFFVTSRPWWNADTKPQTRASSTPTRELHYYCRKEGSGKRGMVMVYGEPPSMHYWTPFVKNNRHLNAEINEDVRLLDYYVKYLATDPGADALQKKEELQAITCFGIRDWSREPFGAGCHIWKPGVRADEAIDQLTNFSLPGAPGGVKNIHICGEAYSDFQGFIEGGLRMARQVVALQSAADEGGHRD